MSNCSKKWFQNFAPKFLSISLTESFFSIAVMCTNV